MSRLDAEYAPEEHHDLARLDDEPDYPGSRYRYISVCACGWYSVSGSTRGQARRAHDRHRDDALGIGCA